MSICVIHIVIHIVFSRLLHFQPTKCTSKMDSSLSKCFESTLLLDSNRNILKGNLPFSFSHSTHCDFVGFNVSLQEAWACLRQGSVKDFLCRKMNHFHCRRVGRKLSHTHSSLSGFIYIFFVRRGCVQTSTYVK